MSASIVVDGTPPVITGFALNAGAAATRSTTVTLVYQANDATSGIATIEASNDADSAAELQIQLDGLKTLSAADFVL